jgi:hypothetical protein
MSLLAEAPSVRHADPLFADTWSGLDDAGLLAHFSHRQGVVFQPVIDPDEIRPERIEGILRDVFEFNGESHALTAPIDWLKNPSPDVEWHILLHKAYYLAGLGLAWQRSGERRYATRWAELVAGWMAVTPVGFIAADVTGRRVQNWITSLHALVLEGRSGEPAPVAPALFRRVLHSLHEQVEFLCHNLTAKRNHRTLELLAIFIAGVVFPEFQAAARWRHFALEQTLLNVQNDLQPDGVHCEQSTDYHHLALRNWLQVRNLAHHNGVPVPGAMDRALEQALVFSMHVHQPSGRVPSFSDGDARSYRPLLSQGALLFGRSDMRFVATAGHEGTAPQALHTHFEDSGYHVLRSDWGDAGHFADAQHLVLDCGPLGEGNHGHFDALSFELAAQGQALIVDPGRYTYSEAGETNWRVHFRGTGAHNTVGVDGLQQTRYLPKPIKDGSRHAAGSVRHKIGGPGPETQTVEVEHRGSRFALVHGRCQSHEYDALHDRCLVMVEGRYWIVSDWLRSPTEHHYRLNFQLSALAQGAARLETTEGSALLRSPHLCMAQAERPGQRVTLEPGWVSELYGHKAEAPRWVTDVQGRDADFDTVIVAGAEPLGQLRVTSGQALCSDGRRSTFTGIQLEAGGQPVSDGWWHARDGAAGRWTIEGMVFVGRWLHWRTDPDGWLVHAISHPGAELTLGGARVALETGASA